MDIKIPELSLVLLIGASGSGKSTFAKKHFDKYEVVSSDECRGIVSNDENDQNATKDAFELLHYIIGKRLKNGLLTVVDATNVQSSARKQLIQLAREYHTLPVAIALDIPQEVCETRNSQRDDRNFGNYVIRQQKQQLKRSLKGLKREGFRKIYGITVSHPAKRQVIFLGDLVDRGYNSPAVLKLVMSMVHSGIAFCVPGNHEMKLQMYLIMAN